ncbi:MAG: hypothetical protein R2755_17945 [Acidimicrobiales bacterium]
MVTISTPSLVIAPDPDGHPGRRLLRMAYDLTLDPAEAAGRPTFEERVVVHAVDEHDAAVPPTREPVLRCTDSFEPASPTVHRSIDRPVARVELDVEQDWWAASNEGEPIPIAEWLDHLVGEISLWRDGEQVAWASTAVVTGSWGALGDD